jgi:hypothetical protein
MQAWTDERMDDLSDKVDSLERRMESGFAETRAEFRAVRGELGALHRVMMQMFAGLWLTMILGFAGLFATILIHS